MALVPLPADVELDGPQPTGLTALPDTVKLDETPKAPSMWEKLKTGLADVQLAIAQQSSRIPLAMPGETPNLAPEDYSQASRTQAGQDVDKRIATREADWQARRQASGDTGTEWVRMGGNAIAAAPFIAALPETGGGVAGGALGGALAGGVGGLLTPVTDTSQGLLGAKAKQVGSGALIGGITGGVLGALGNKAGSAPDAYRQDVNYLRERNVTPTVGQNIGPRAATWEDMTSTLNWNVPGAQRKALESYNLGGMNEALAPLGLEYKGAAGREAFKNVAGVIDNAYDSIKGNVSLPVSDEIRGKIGQVVADAATPDPSIAKSVQNILDKALYNHIGEDGVLSGTGFKSAEEALGKWAKKYGTENATATERNIGDALEGVQSVLREALADANPQYAAQLKATNRAYAVLARLQKAVPTGDPDGLFTPARLAMAVRQADNTVRDRAYTEGDALLQRYSDAGLRVLGNKFPNSGTAGRMLSADPFAWPFQIGASLALSPVYSQPGQKLLGKAISAGSNAGSLLGPNVQKLAPYAMPGLLGK